MQIVSAGTAFPRNSYEQDVITAKLQERWNVHLPRPETLSRLHTRCGVSRRNLVLPAGSV
jgi:predicted naringenin-chalcone synthase